MKRLLCGMLLALCGMGTRNMAAAENPRDIYLFVYDSELYCMYDNTMSLIFLKETPTKLDTTDTVATVSPQNATFTKINIKFLTENSSIIKQIIDSPAKLYVKFTTEELKNKNLGITSNNVLKAKTNTGITVFEDIRTKAIDWLKKEKPELAEKVEEKIQEQEKLDKEKLEKEKLEKEKPEKTDANLGIYLFEHDGTLYCFKPTGKTEIVITTEQKNKILKDFGTATEKKITGIIRTTIANGPNDIVLLTGDSTAIKNFFDERKGLYVQFNQTILPEQLDDIGAPLGKKYLIENKAVNQNFFNIEKAVKEEIEKGKKTEPENKKTKYELHLYLIDNEPYIQAPYKNEYGLNKGKQIILYRPGEASSDKLSTPNPILTNTIETDDKIVTIYFTDQNVTKSDYVKFSGYNLTTVDDDGNTFLNSTSLTHPDKTTSNFIREKLQPYIDKAKKEKQEKLEQEEKSKRLAEEKSEEENKKRIKEIWEKETKEAELREAQKKQERIEKEKLEQKKKDLEDQLKQKQSQEDKDKLLKQLEENKKQQLALDKQKREQEDKDRKLAEQKNKLAADLARAKTEKELQPLLDLANALRKMVVKQA